MLFLCAIARNRKALKKAFQKEKGKDFTWKVQNSYLLQLNGQVHYSTALFKFFLQNSLYQKSINNYFFTVVVACLSSCHRKLQTLTIGRSVHFYSNKYFMFPGICTCLRVFSGPILLWISRNVCPLKLLFVRISKPSSRVNNHRKQKRLIEGRNNVTGCALN